MTYTIVGAGAIGATIGAHMIRAGQDVLFADIDAAHVDAINTRGLTIRGYAETLTVPARAVLVDDLPAQLDQVILAVKAPATKTAMQQILPRLAQDGFVLSAQNGLNELGIADLIGRTRTLGCFVNFSADYIEPGLIEFGGPGSFFIGELDGQITPRLEALQQALSGWEDGAAGLRRVRTTDNIWGYLWGKMGYGAMLFATSVANESMADAIDTQRDTLVALSREVLAVADAEGIKPVGFDGFEPDILRGDDEAARDASIARLVEVRRRDKKIHSGVWRDLAVRKRRTEVDSQFWPILERAEVHGLRAPILRKMVDMIHEIEDGKRPLVRANLDELAEAHVLTEVSREGLWDTNSVIASWIRLSGSPEEREAFDFCKRVLDTYGMRTKLLEHPALISYPLEASLELVDRHGILVKVFKCLGTAYSRSADGVTGELIDLGWGEPADYAGKDVRGKIVLINGLATPSAVRLAEAAGAVAQIFINDAHLHNMIVSPVWGTPTPETAPLLPKTSSVSVLEQDGLDLRARITAGGAFVRVKSKVFMQWQTTPILVAELDGEERDFVLFSGHLDSWEYGAMDNGSANTTMIEVARILAAHKQHLKRGLRMILWSGHSHGRYSGSTWYVDNHWEEMHDRCVAHVNIDSTGARGATLYSHELANLELSQFGANVLKQFTGQDAAFSRMSRAGDMSFMGTGIPALFMSLSQVPIDPQDKSYVNQSHGKLFGSGMPWWWHTSEDTIDKVDLDVLALDTRVYLATLWRMCTLPVLPMSFVPVANDIARELDALQQEAGAHIDLGQLRARAAKLLEGAAHMAVRAGELARQDKPDAAAFNAALKAVSRVLIPITYTEHGQFDHDLALGAPHLPTLQGARQLAKLEPDSNEYQFLRTRVKRNSNAVAHALRQALDIIGVA